MFAFLASNRKELREIMVEAIIELRRRGLEWKMEGMEFTTWRVEDGDDGGSVCFEVKQLGALKALIIAEPNSMMAMTNRMSQADRAMWVDVGFLQKQKTFPHEEFADNIKNVGLRGRGYPMDGCHQ